MEKVLYIKHRAPNWIVNFITPVGKSTYTFNNYRDARRVYFLLKATLILKLL